MQNYVKGAFIPADEATIHVSERGFRFGDGVFETIRIAQSLPLFYEQHAKRLYEGLNALAIPHPQEDLYATCIELIARNQQQDGILRISVSRGIGSKGYLPTDLLHPPTVVIEQLPLPATSIEPVTLWHSGIRKPSPRTLPIQHKLSQGLNATLARIEAQQNACDETLLTNESHHICEASSSNIFWNIGEVIYTPALECGLLAGTTRHRLLNHWRSNLIESAFTIDELAKAESVIITNAITGAIPVKKLAPTGIEWQDFSLAKHANSLLQQDIDTEIAQQQRL